MNKITRGALVLAGTAGTAVALAVPSNAVSGTVLSTTPPDVTTIVPQMAGGLTNGIIDGFTTLLPFVIPVMVIFTVWAFAKRLTGAKKSAR